MTQLFGLEHAHSEHSEQLRVRVAKLESKVAQGSASSADEAELRQLSLQLPKSNTAIVEQLLLRLEAAQADIPASDDGEAVAEEPDF